MQYDWQELPKITFIELERLCPPGEYRAIEPVSLPAGILSSGLVAKIHSILVMSSGIPNGRIYFMFNLNRIDYNEMDQMPYGIAFDKSEVLPSGILIQHGSYHNRRTTPIPGDFYNFITASGLYPLSEMPKSHAGSIAELKIDSQEKAFKTIVSTIQITFPEEKS